MYTDTYIRTYIHTYIRTSYVHTGRQAGRQTGDVNNADFNYLMIFTRLHYLCYTVAMYLKVRLRMQKSLTYCYRNQCLGEETNKLIRVQFGSQRCIFIRTANLTLFLVSGMCCKALLSVILPDLLDNLNLHTRICPFVWLPFCMWVCLQIQCLHTKASSLSCLSL